ncbi:MAG TPA: SDR family oxidoreductase [Bryobacteraceae bacterium]|nr:SDR family oxidoreductase [Bryobacteraceae bacterium]
MPDGQHRPLALITGASSGLGATFAGALAARGYDLVLVARRQDRLDALAEKLAAEHGIRAETLAADLTAEEGLALVEDRIARADALELLVNNAGFGTRGRFWEAPLAGQLAMHRLHVIATMRLAHAALAGMTARRRGAIINVASVAGFMQAGSTSYSATKAWMISFTEGLYIELQRDGSPVKVQALCPGFTVTEFHDAMGVSREEVPARLWMRAEDVVRTSLEALDRGKLVVVPGWFYKFIVKLVPALPRFLRYPLLIRAGRRRQRY